eukprot:11570875-Alexandrium_andersonii.AAC.1
MSAGTRWHGCAACTPERSAHTCTRPEPAPCGPKAYFQKGVRRAGSENRCPNRAGSSNTGVRTVQVCHRGVTIKRSSVQEAQSAGAE